MEVKGLDQLFTRLKEMPEKTATALRIISRRNASNFAKQLKAVVRSRWGVGDLYRSITVARSRKSTKFDARYYVAFVSDMGMTQTRKAAKALGVKMNKKYGRKGYHWRFLESGTKNMQARPFLKTTLATFDSGDAVQYTLDWINKNV